MLECCAHDCGLVAQEGRYRVAAEGFDHDYPRKSEAGAEAKRDTE